VTALLREQFQQAHNEQINISRVIMIGGFSVSGSLNECVQEWLGRHNLPVPITSGGTEAGIVVAKGAVLRALNKEHGPSRFVRSSFGIAQHIQYLNCQIAFKQGRRELYKVRHLAEDGLDGMKYVKNCIHWFIAKVT
jgi:hypothetical protein